MPLALIILIVGVVFAIIGIGLTFRQADAGQHTIDLKVAKVSVSGSAALVIVMGGLLIYLSTEIAPSRSFRADTSEAAPSTAAVTPAGTPADTQGAPGPAVQSPLPDVRLLTWYRDQDGDGFGDASAVRRAATQPPRYVARAGDCFDRNPQVKPQQRASFASHRGDGSFDYDCDGRAVLVWTAVRQEGTFPNCDPTKRLGWEPPVPKCGQTGRWLIDSDVRAFPPQCRQEYATRTQKCR